MTRGHWGALIGGVGVGVHAPGEAPHSGLVPWGAGPSKMTDWDDLSDDEVVGRVAV